MIPKHHELRKCFKLPDPGEQVFLDSSIGIVDRREVSKTSLHDQANLLLSFASIAHSEILKCPSALADDGETQGSSFPSFPKSLEEDDVVSHSKSVLIPRNESLRQALIMGFPTSTARLRSVSFDSPMSSAAIVEDLSPSPLPPPPCLTPFLANLEDTAMKRRYVKKGTHKHIKRGTSSKIGRKKHSRSMDGARKFEHTKIPKPAVVSPRPSVSTVHQEDIDTFSMEAPLLPKKTSLQSPPANGVSIKKIFRRKFSWKNYPELEAFLVTNREEYLRHSALNYTLQQKHYNNQLTTELLNLATKYGYMFDESDFNFVTVRDRIRCYYKSFVQSAKKRGVLMGYAAKKAGLLTDHDLLGGQNLDDDDDASASSDSIAMDLTTH